MQSPEVDAYIAAAPPLRRERLEALRALVHRLAPDVEEVIEYRMPLFRRGDKWIAMASQKSCLSVYLHCQPHAAAIVATDPRLKGGKGCVNIVDSANLPLAALEPAIAGILAGEPPPS